MPASQDVAAVTSATFAVSVSAQGGAFTGAVALMVSGLPTGANATFSPASVTPGSAGAQSTLTVSTPATFAVLRETGATVLALAGCLLLMVRKRKQLVLYCLLIFASLAGYDGAYGLRCNPAAYGNVHRYHHRHQRIAGADDDSEADTALRLAPAPG